jgi:aspartyl-tRNA(Asn)/glutamyl-tRNA(Gln) amidotransferase subunit A
MPAHPASVRPRQHDGAGGAGTGMNDWLWMSACDLGRGIGAGEIDPVALTEAYLDAAEAHAYRDRIYTTLTRERALGEAEAAAHRARHGVRRGLLDGVPISWKDLFDSAGTATEAGSRLLEGRVPEADAEVLARATRAGLVCLGKTHMSELAFAGLGLNPAYRGTAEGATPPNVHDPARVPGGSSSGAAASVAYGLAAAGIGSDTGGSVRVPSAWNDVVGLKTTTGRLSLEGVVPLAESFDTVGPLCRSVEDAAHLLAVMEGGAAADLTGASLKGARFLVLEPYASDAAEAQAQGFSRALGRLGDAGATIERGEVAAIGPAMDLSPSSSRRRPTGPGATPSRPRLTGCSTAFGTGSGAARPSRAPTSSPRGGACARSGATGRPRLPPTTPSSCPPPRTPRRRSRG